MVKFDFPHLIDHTRFGAVCSETKIDSLAMMNTKASNILTLKSLFHVMLLIPVELRDMIQCKTLLTVHLVQRKYSIGSQYLTYKVVWVLYVH